MDTKDRIIQGYAQRLADTTHELMVAVATRDDYAAEVARLKPFEPIPEPTPKPTE